MTGIIERHGDGFVLQLGVDEREVVARLLDELREMLHSAQRQARTSTSEAEAQLLARLFPVVHPDDAEAEAEYQHLMRGELITSRLAAIDTVLTALRSTPAPRRRQRTAGTSLSEAEVMTFMQAVNSVRLVLGTMLDVSDDDGDDDIPPDDDALAPEHHLYGYLSWLLDSAVMAVTQP